METAEQIKEIVKEKYGQIAKQSNTQIQSITVYATKGKQESCCNKNTGCC